MTTKNHKYIDIILVSFVSMLLISNLAATKLISFGSIITDGGAVLFPLIYIFNDVITEVYGYKYARRAIWLGFLMMILAVLAFTLVRYLPSAPYYTSQDAYVKVLGFFPRIVLASLCAYLIGSFVSSIILAKMKVITKGKKLWARLVGSTIIGEFLDTLVFGVVAFAGILTLSDLVKFIMIGWIFKTMVEVLLLPVTYRVINYIKKSENVDFYDKKTDFNPVHLNL